MVELRIVFLVSIYLVTCFSWTYNYHLKGSLLVEADTEVKLFGYEEYQDVDKELKSTRYIQNGFEEISIYMNKATYLMDTGSPECTVTKKIMSVLFDSYIKFKDSMTTDLPSRTIMGQECKCVGNQDDTVEYCENSDASPCYFSFPSNKEKNTFTLSSIEPFNVTVNPFVPDLYHYCPELGKTTGEDFRFPDEFHGQIRKHSIGPTIFVNFGFSSKEKVFYFESDTGNVYNFNTGTILTMDTFTNNINIEAMKASNLKCVDLSGSTYEPVIKYLELGPTTPGYYVDLTPNNRRYTTFVDNVLRNFFTKNEGGKQVIYQATSYDTNNKEFSVFDVNYKEESMLRQSFFETVDLEAAYLENDSDKEIVIEFIADTLIEPTKQEEYNLRNQISKIFDKTFESSIDVRRVMARRVEIDYSRVYMYAKIANKNFFNDVYLKISGKPVNTTADIVNTADSYAICETFCAAKDCSFFHFDSKVKEKNCNLYHRYLNKTEVDPNGLDSMGTRLSKGSKMDVEDFKKTIDAALDKSPWKMELDLMGGEKVSISSKSKSKSFSDEEKIAMMNNFGVEEIALSLNSLKVSRNAMLKGKYLVHGKSTLKDCIDSFINIRKNVKMNAFMYNKDFYECIFITEIDGTLIESYGIDLYEYKPTESFEVAQLALSSDGFIGKTESLNDCADICLRNSTNFVTLDTADAKMAVPFERVCLGVQFVSSSKMCYLVFDAIETSKVTLDSNDDHKTYRRKIGSNFNNLIIFTTDSIKESFGTLLPKSAIPLAKCIELYNLECSFITVCNKKDTKEQLVYANNADMNLTNILKTTDQENYDCVILQNYQDIPNIITKDVYIKEEKYRSLSNGAVAGITIFIMIIGIVIGVVVGKVLIR